MKPTLAGFIVVLSALLAGCVDSGGNSSSGFGARSGHEAGAGSIQLSWHAPQRREDGSPLPPGHIDRYEVHYGQLSGAYERVAEVLANGADTATINSLSAGTWYFAVKAIDLDGRPSRFSEEQSVSIE